MSCSNYSHTTTHTCGYKGKKEGKKHHEAANRSPQKSIPTKLFTILPNSAHSICTSGCAAPCRLFTESIGHVKPKKKMAQQWTFRCSNIWPLFARHRNEQKFWIMASIHLVTMIITFYAPGWCASNIQAFCNLPWVKQAKKKVGLISRCTSLILLAPCAG